MEKKTRLFLFQAKDAAPPLATHTHTPHTPAGVTAAQARVLKPKKPPFSPLLSDALCTHPQAAGHRRARDPTTPLSLSFDRLLVQGAT